MTSYSHSVQIRDLQLDTISRGRKILSKIKAGQPLSDLDHAMLQILGDLLLDIGNQAHRSASIRHTPIGNSPNGASFSHDRKYRYALWRTWDSSKGHVMFIGLNPSTADETEDDLTVKKCKGFAERWGFGGIVIANLFAFRASDPIVMEGAAEPVGPENDRYLRMLADDAALVVAAWGEKGGHMGRSGVVRDELGDLSCIRILAHGEPAHPSRSPYTHKPVDYIR